MPKRGARSKANAVDEEGNKPQEAQEDQQPPPPSLLDHCPDTTVNPYELMGITRDATEADIKRAYKKGALRWHPDKHPEDQKYKAQKAFQQLTTAYAVLGDPVRRSHYDATGKVHEALHLDPNDPWSWQPFYQHCWAEMAEGDIEAFAKEYRFSEEERQDLLMQYTTHKGNMTKVYEHVTLSNPLEDDDRYRKWINEAIKKDEVKSYKAFVKESVESIKYRKDEAKKEAEEAEELKQMLKKSGSWFDPPSDHEGHDLLALAVREKNKSRSIAFLDEMMAKYGNKPSRKKGNESLLSEPSEEAFERNRKKSFEEALKRDKERQQKKTSTTSRKRKAEEINDDRVDEPDGKHPVKKWNTWRKKVQQEMKDAKAAEAADPSSEEEGQADQADLDEEIYGEPRSNDEAKPTAKSKSKTTTAKRKAPVKKPAPKNAKSKAAPVPKARPKRGRRAVVQEEEEEEEEEGNIELGSEDSDEYDENEG